MGGNNDFGSMRTSFSREVEKSLKTGGVDNIKAAFDSLNCKESEKRGALEQAIRDRLLDLLSKKTKNVDAFKKLVDLSIQLCRKGTTVPMFSVTLLSDTFDSVTIKVCEQLFSYVESNLSTWKDTTFFGPCKNNILRMCNGLNIVSEFNLENVTLFDEDEDNLVDNESQITTKEGGSFYKQFWSLQDFFRSPNQCYNDSQWKEFVNITNSVLSMFKSSKLEADVVAPSEKKNLKDEEIFFPKFLTSQKLLVLQRSNVNFQRTIYLQFLILFQYLQAQVKSKPESYELKSEQETWVKETSSVITNLIKNTPPDGEEFLLVVTKALEREEHWNNWKNEGCPALNKNVIAASSSFTFRKPVKRGKSLGQLVKDGAKHRRISLETESGTKVWDLRRDHLKRCVGQDNIPKLDKFFEEAILQLDPAGMIEPQYRKSNDMKWAWPALKLLAMKSPHFFAPNSVPVDKLSDFLELMCKKLTRDLAIAAQRAAKSVKPGAVQVSEESKNKPSSLNNVGGNVGEDSQKNYAEEMEVSEENLVEDGDDEEETNGQASPSDLNQNDSNSDGGTQYIKLTDHELAVIGEKIAHDWQKVAAKLGYKPDEVEYFSSCKDNDVDRAFNMLKVWVSNEENASAETLVDCLEALDFHKASKVIIEEIQ